MTKISQKITISVLVVIFVITAVFIFSRNIKNKDSLLANSLTTQSKSLLTTEQYNKKIEEQIKKSKSGTQDKAISDLLIKRKTVLLLETEHNPSIINSLALPESTRKALESSGYTDLEKDVDIIGNVEIMHHDDFEHPEHETFEYYLVDSLYKKYKLNVVNQDQFAPGDTLQFTGKMIDDLLIGEAKIFQVAEKVPHSHDEKAAPSKIPYKIGIFLVTPDGDRKLPFKTAADASNYIFNGTYQKYIQESSYQKRNVTGDVYGWITIPNTTSCNSVNLLTPELGNYITTHNISPENYDHILYILNCGGSNGWSTIGSTTQIYQTVDGLKFFHASSSWINIGPQAVTYQYPFKFKWTPLDFLLVHELGHAFGLLHANGLDCNQQMLYGSSCNHMEYGNMFDSMGNSIHALQFSGWYKNILGWINPSDVLTITSSGTYTLNAMEASVGKKYAVISNPAFTNTDLKYYVENRRAIGFDSTLNDASLTQNQNGLLISRSQQSLWLLATRLIDTHPTVQNWTEDIKDAALTQNSIFTDNDRGVVIGPITNVANNSITFQVTINPTMPSCTHVAPSVSVPGGGFYHKTIQGPELLLVRIYNNDSGSCGSSDFVTKIQIPAPLLLSSVGMWPASNFNVLPRDVNQDAYIWVPFINNAPLGTYPASVTVQNITSGMSTSQNINLTVLQ